MKRLVFLSSASVHGQAPAPETNEETPLHDHHDIVYNNAKVRAEWALERLAGDGVVETVRLRPSVVFGPRSRWIADVANALTSGRMLCVEGGAGLCNSLYIDNLVDAIQLSAVCENAKGQAFLIGDGEEVRWRDLFISVAEHLKIDSVALKSVPAPLIAPEREDRFAVVKRHSFYQSLGRAMPDRMKAAIKGFLSGLLVSPPSAGGWSIRRTCEPSLTTEMALLQQCKWLLPTTKAERILGYRARVPFSEGMKRSLTWLDFLE